MTERIFAGQTVVITGASRGLGRACAESFAAAGASLVLVARPSEELERLATHFRANGVDAVSAPCDVTNDEQVAHVFEQLQRCDVLVNNAGMNRPQPFIDVDLGTLDEILTLNVRSVFVVAQAAARRMVQAGSGVVINMTSQMGHVGSVNRTVYCLSKHAIEGLTKAMAVELAPRGVRVCSVAPTYVETPMTKPFFENETFKQDVLRKIPLGRIGTMEEVAAAVLFMASPAASLITGTSLLVDGGYTAQ
ncbi:SDR family NAD(P)-dependent oxidoreductase [Steroidobacter sp.]|uniref:SDR family NAD(P)-dependent oxidoreductase n=1 Tax=Steroidobacter sp. TaxID=1978227 RepID=UPI001A4CFB4E|nr:SDR family oxidoreductase [Steroidobacter sp.]MBL8266036.1 SDR family oxidoreductase [Steroidobacter sp.]